MFSRRRWLMAFGFAMALTLNGAQVVRADPPPDAPTSPFPDMSVVRSFYTELPPEHFFIPEHYGVWFLTPTGVNCGIWDRGGFGCVGDIPGAPPGVDNIAWFNGNRAVHYGWTAAMQFRPGQAQVSLAPRSFVTYNSTTCVMTSDANTYCEHGPFRFLMTPTGTWLKGWDDGRSHVCLSHGSC